MVILGVDAHKRSHTVVGVDELGRQGASKTCGTTTRDHLRQLQWAAEQGKDRLWAVEDCRHLSWRLERDLLAAGEKIVRVPPKLMAHARDGARTYGKSDPIDALAVARAALREPGLPVARLDGAEREVRLLVDHREDLAAERTRMIGRLRWHLHELDPGWRPPAKIERASAYDRAKPGYAVSPAPSRAWPALWWSNRRRLTFDIDALETEITTLIERLSPSLLGIRGCGALTAAKIVGETAGVDRFRSKDAYARHTGTAPPPVWSSNGAPTGSPAPATASSTPRCTASPSPRRTGTPKPEP